MEVITCRRVVRRFCVVCTGSIVGIMYVDSRPFEAFAYNDVDVANNLGQL